MARVQANIVAGCAVGQCIVGDCVPALRVVAKGFSWRTAALDTGTGTLTLTALTEPRSVEKEWPDKVLGEQESRKSKIQLPFASFIHANAGQVWFHLTHRNTIMQRQIGSAHGNARAADTASTVLARCRAER
jgi:hypothetical protein